MAVDYTSLGLIAGALTTLALVPQVEKIHRTKSARDLSWLWLGTLTLGLIAWIAYGILLSSIPLIAANVATLVLAVAMILMKAEYDKRTIV